METVKTIHIASAALFLLDYLIKTILLLMGSSALEGYKKVTKVPSMIISTMFLASGIYMISKIGMSTIGGWFHLKLTLVIIGIVIGIIGFKKNSKVLAVLSTILFLYVYGLSETKSISMGMGKNSTNDVITDTADVNYNVIVHGKAIYINECMRCHGEDGKAGINGASDLTASLCENRGLIGIIKHGRNLMPAYKEKLSEQEIFAVAEYVKSIRINTEATASDSTSI